ncbi:MAG: PTS sugar transporter subunit IIB [Anaerolineales bacterium]
MTKKGTEEPLLAVTICGVGMGSSLILRMTSEKAFKELGVNAKVVATDVGSARSMQPDIIIGQAMHTEEFEGVAPVIVSITNFTDHQALKEKLTEPLRQQGWME